MTTAAGFLCVSLSVLLIATGIVTIDAGDKLLGVEIISLGVCGMTMIRLTFFKRYTQ